ncbi:hypothetical protein BKA62DRAFT_687336 [Auriculariales sp. MPI-PUGE-AT-0066]|nr:hypothetical protein BKA62DRAFT_687336 [Auriculariales sp. MPI-PUGE-AT-0066]
MLEWAQNHARNTLATHETTRRFAELVADVITSAAGYIPFVGGTAQFFKEQAHDMLQAPYATLQQSHSENEELVVRLRDQLLVCEEELFEARRELKLLKGGAPAFWWAVGPFEALPTSVNSLDPDDTTIHLQSGEHALQDTLKLRTASLIMREKELLQRIRVLEEFASTRERDLAVYAKLKQELQLREEEIHSRELQLQSQATERSIEQDPSILRTRLEAAEERIRVLENLLARALAAEDVTANALDKGEPPATASGLHTPPASEKDAALPSDVPTFEPRLSRVLSTFEDTSALLSRYHNPYEQPDAHAEHDTPALAPALEESIMPGGSPWFLDEAPPPELGTSLDTLPGTVDVHGQHFTTFSAVDDFEAAQDHRTYMPGHWATPAVESVLLPVADSESSVHDSYEDDIDVHSGFEGLIEHDLGVGIQIHHSLELAPPAASPSHDDRELDMQSGVEDAVDVHYKAVEPLLIDGPAIKTEADQVAALAEETYDEPRRSRVESMHSTHTHHSILGADISASPERYLFDRDAPKPVVDSFVLGDEHVDSSDEEVLATLRPPVERGSRDVRVEEEEEVVIPPAPVKVEAAEESRAPASIKQEEIDGPLSPSGTFVEAVRTETVPQDDPIEETSQVSMQAANYIMDTVPGSSQLAAEPSTPGYFVAKQHLFDDEPKSFPPSPTSSKGPEAPTITEASDALKSSSSAEAAYVPAVPSNDVMPSSQQPTDVRAKSSDTVIEAMDKLHTVTSAQPIPPTSRPDSPSDSGSDRAASPSRTPQKKRTSGKTFELLRRAIHGTPSVEALLAEGDVGDNSGHKSSLSQDAHRRRSSGIHFAEQEDSAERLSAVNDGGSTRGRLLSKSPNGKGDALAATKQRPGSSNRTKERPRSRVLNVFGIERKVSSGDAELGEVKAETGSEELHSKARTTELEAKLQRGSRRSLIERFSSLRGDSKRNKDRN